jgi:gas vesicle protein
MSKVTQKEGNQFVLGLIIGILAGSTAYFLFTTDQGEELRKDFKKRWLDIQEDIPSVTELTIGDLKVRDLINIVLGLETKEKTKKPNLKRIQLIKESTRPSSTSRNKKPKKFKGL